MCCGSADLFIGTAGLFFPWPEEVWIWLKAFGDNCVCSILKNDKEERELICLYVKTLKLLSLS